MTRLQRLITRSRFVLVAALGLFVWACAENLPVGPTVFTGTMSTSTWPDTIVVGDVKRATIKLLDIQEREVLDLRYTLTFADTTLARFVVDATNGNTGMVTALKTGATTASIALPDSRFTVPTVSKPIRVVVGGVNIMTAHDTTLTAINDTATAIASSVIKVSGANADRPGQGVQWTQRGSSVTVVGTRDTIKYIAKAPGVDTLIVSHSYCLAGARCADTLYARVAQSLKLTLSSKAFTAWTFGDTAGPTVTLADRRGTGLAGTSIRLVPVTAADSARATLTAATYGATNATTGAMAVKRMIAAGNGTAKVAVIGLKADGTTADTDTITYAIRQLASRSSVEPLRAQLTEKDTIPVKVSAQDIRGNNIADLTYTLVVSTGLAVSNSKINVSVADSAFTGTVSATVTGAALYSNNTGAPTREVAVDTTRVTVLKAITLSSDAASREQSISLLLKSPGGTALANRWVRLLKTAGTLSADSVKTDADGLLTATWTPTTTSGRQIFTALVPPEGSYAAITDSAGKIVVRRSVTISAGAPAAATSTLAVDDTTLAAGETATISVTMRDAAGNLVTTADTSQLVISATKGSLGDKSCSAGVCSVTFTAETAGTGSVSATIGGDEVDDSPVSVTITAGAPTKIVITTQPVAGAATNVAFATQPVVKVADAYGNTVNTAAFTITAAASEATGTAALGGTKVLTSVAGVVTFTDLSFSAGVTGNTMKVNFTGNDGTITLTSVKSNTLTNP